jgi:hypothetical protein
MVLLNVLTRQDADRTLSARAHLDEQQVTNRHSTMTCAWAWSFSSRVDKGPLSCRRQDLNIVSRVCQTHACTSEAEQYPQKRTPDSFHYLQTTWSARRAAAVRTCALSEDFHICRASCTFPTRYISTELGRLSVLRTA